MNDSAEKHQFAILKILCSSNEPLGAGAVSEKLAALDISISEATAGRVLRGMRNEGLLERKGFQGHTVTKRGRDRMREMETRVRLDEILDSCMPEESNVIPSLCNVLEALRFLGRESLLKTVKLGDAVNLSSVEEAINCYKDSGSGCVKEGLFGAFYQALFQTSGIPMFEQFFSLLGVAVLGDPRMLKVFRRAEMTLADTYEDILDSVRAGEPGLAVAKMENQIDRAITHIKGGA